jgi:hypothetical protein
MSIPTICRAASSIGVFLFATNLVTLASRADQPAPATVAAFDRYVRASESRKNEELASKKSFLWIDTPPEREREQTYALLKQGQIFIRRSLGCESRSCDSVPGGLIHDWFGVVFVPGVSLAQTLATLQDYDHDADYYQPQVVRAKLLARSGNTFRVFLRLRQTHVMTVVLDTEYEIQNYVIDGTHAASHSYSTRIAEVESVGLPQEHLSDPRDTHGFLWRLNSYWHFYEADGGVYIQCNAISLTRDVPTGLGWLIGPFIENIPREALRFTLTATRQALLERFNKDAHK